MVNHPECSGVEWAECAICQATFTAITSARVAAELQREWKTLQAKRFKQRNRTPPLQLRPKWVWIADRLKEIERAAHAYTVQHREVPREYVEELDELQPLMEYHLELTRARGYRSSFRTPFLQEHETMDKKNP